MHLPVCINLRNAEAQLHRAEQGPNGKWAGETGRRKTQSGHSLNKLNPTHKPHLKQTGLHLQRVPWYPGSESFFPERGTWECGVLPMCLMCLLLGAGSPNNRSHTRNRATAQQVTSWVFPGGTLRFNQLLPLLRTLPLNALGTLKQTLLTPASEVNFLFILKGH